MALAPEVLDAPYPWPPAGAEAVQMIALLPMLAPDGVDVLEPGTRFDAPAERAYLWVLAEKAELVGPRPAWWPPAALASPIDELARRRAAVGAA